VIGISVLKKKVKEQKKDLDMEQIPTKKIMERRMQIQINPRMEKE